MRQQAKRIILTNEGGLDSEARWQTETPYLIELILRSFALGPDMVVLDYGCGIGRVAKAMIEVSGCSVVGLDISGSMRQLARDYVGSDRFIAVSPGQYDTMVAAGLRVNAAIAVWVLQHCLQPAEDIARIRRSIVPKGRIFVLNMSAWWGAEASTAATNLPGFKMKLTWLRFCALNFVSRRKVPQTGSRCRMRPHSRVFIG